MVHQVVPDGRDCGDAGVPLVHCPCGGDGHGAISRVLPQTKEKTVVKAMQDLVNAMDDIVSKKCPTLEIEKKHGIDIQFEAFSDDRDGDGEGDGLKSNNAHLLKDGLYYMEFVADKTKHNAEFIGAFSQKKG